MIKLTGSEKQIAWATTIRDNNINTLKTEIENFKARGQREDWDYSEIIAKIEKAIEDIKVTKSDAKWWIENKGVASSFLQRIMAKK